MVPIVSESWMRLYTYESNLLAFNEAYSPGHPSWDGHFSALRLAVKAAEKRVMPSFMMLHKVMVRRANNEKAGWLRKEQDVVPPSCPPWYDVPMLLEGWRKVAMDQMHPDSFKIEQEAYKRIAGLHYDIIRISPFAIDNDRLARILAASLAVLAEVDPILFLYENKTTYEAPLLDARK